MLTRYNSVGNGYFALVPGIQPGTNTAGIASHHQADSAIKARVGPTDRQPVVLAQVLAVFALVFLIADAAVAVNQVVTFAAVEARLRGTLIDVGLARVADETGQAETLEASVVTDAGASVQARQTGAPVRGTFAVEAVVAFDAQAYLGLESFIAETGAAVLTWVVCTFSHLFSVTRNSSDSGRSAADDLRRIRQTPTMSYGYVEPIRLSVTVAVTSFPSYDTSLKASQQPRQIFTKYHVVSDCIVYSDSISIFQVVVY